jgi:hypothetical protein
MESAADGSNPRQIATRYLGNQIGAQGGLLAFDQLELVHNVALQSDVYVIDEMQHRVRRVTHLARAADPDIASNGRTVVCTVQRADRRDVATFEMPSAGFATPSILVSEAGTEYSSPRWSPDGRSIAVERRELGGPSEIAIVDLASRRVRTLVSSRSARNVTPRWLSSATLLFASDRDGKPFSIYRVDVDTGVIRRLNGTGASALAPVVSPDGETIVFVGYTTDGYDLFSIPLASASWSDVTSPVVSTAPSQNGSRGMSESNTIADRPYRPWRTLLPQFWMPIVESDAGEFSGGAATAGTDALGRHTYGAAAAWTASRVRPDWSVAYAYDRWWPTFFASVSDDTDPWRGGDIRTRELNAGALFTVARVRWSQNILAAMNASEDSFSCQSCTDSIQQGVRRGAIRLGWMFDDAKSYGYSISRESGATVRFTWENAPKALGSDAGTRAMTIDTRAYAHVGPRHAAIAIRAAGAAAWGDTETRRIFSAAGSDAASASFDFGRRAVGLLRGFQSDTVAASRVAIANVDFRFPLRYIQRGSGTAPLFLRTMHSAVFVDAGNAWDQASRWSDVRVSAGAEVAADTVVGFGVPLSFTAGVAWRRDPVGRQDGVVAFGRIGRAF